MLLDIRYALIDICSVWMGLRMPYIKTQKTNSIIEKLIVIKHLKVD